MKLEDRVLIGTYLDRYGALLTSAQREIVSAYCLYDFSLSEIASNRNISRSAVEDSLKKAIRKLEKYEEAIGLNKKKEALLKALEKKDMKALEEEVHGI